MLNLLSKTKYGPIAIDLGAEGVRMLQLRRSGGDFTVHAAGRWHTPGGLSLGEATRTRQAIEGVRGLLAHGAFKGNRSVSCIRSRDLSINNARLLDMPEGELAEGVLLREARERFAFEVAPDRLFHVNAGEVCQGGQLRQEVLLLAVREETVARHVEMLRRMGLEPEHIGAEPTSLFRAYRRLAMGDGNESADRQAGTAFSVIVDIGQGDTKVLVASGGTILLIKTIEIGGDRFDERVARELNLSTDEARDVRTRAAAKAAGHGLPQRDASRLGGAGNGTGGPIRWSVVDAIRGDVEELCREIGLCLRYCALTFRGLSPTAVTVTGGEAYDPALMRLMNDRVGVPCRVGEPLRGIDLGEADLESDPRGCLTEWSLATGLALRGLMGCTESDKASHERCRVPA